MVETTGEVKMKEVPFEEWTELRSLLRYAEQYACNTVVRKCFHDEIMFDMEALLAARV